MKNSLLLILLLCCSSAWAADKNTVSQQNRDEIAKALTRITAREVKGNVVRIDRANSTRKKVSLYASVGLSYYPFREQNVRAIYDSIRAMLPSQLRKARIEIITDNRRIEELIPVALRRSVDSKKSPAFTYAPRKQLVTNTSSVWLPASGLRNRHIALWQSHGRYFEQKEDRWKWQRSRLWETCEDLYTQSYILQFIVPMLENAGANVLMPRERDVNKIELVADNDRGVDYATRYTEESGARGWNNGGVGFAHTKSIYRSGENPFAHGTVRAAETITSGAESTAVWSANITEQGEYAIYVSYKTLPNSSDDAMYSVSHMGGTTTFAVNQTMGGGTWIYLGSFNFAAGDQGAVVTLSNRSSRAGRVVTTDAVKIGGGFGNISRTVCDSLRRRGVVYTEQTSGYPRFCEGARYWLQWAGFAEDVYAAKNHKDDYREDYMSRAHWVNALMGGTERLPNQKGLSIPIDLSLGLHTDAGVRDGDDVVGTLGIFCTKDNDGRFEGGVDRYLSRDLTDLVMTQIVSDTRATFEPEWVRRGLWNRAYYEPRIPSGPSILLELLSHQNFADMRYGHDPRFKFMVSRAIYKGILRFVNSQYGTPYVVQPLPVEAFSAELTDANEVTLSWQPTHDTLEPTAEPKGYIVYTRIDGGAFDQGRLVKATTCSLPIEKGRLYSFRVVAVNDGGKSFPSETLAACRVEGERGRVMVVNGFDRVSAPLSIREDTTAGFRRDLDAGVPYMSDISFIGNQRVFDSAMARSENDRIALGSSDTDFETEVLAGNTFDYPVLHGEAIAKAGWSFASASVRAVEQGDVSLRGYQVVDLVLGLQRTVEAGSGSRGWEFECFSPSLQDVLRGYAKGGGALFVSGSYAVNDLWQGGAASAESRAFGAEVLHIGHNASIMAQGGRVIVAPSEAGFTGNDYRLNAELGPESYAVGLTDVLQVSDGAFPVLRYTQSRKTAGVAWAGSGAGRTVVVGFPFESIDNQQRRGTLMRDVLNFLDPINK